MFGFFLGMAVGLFEDLSIFLHIHEIFGAITQLPALIGSLTNVSLVKALILDFIVGHMTRCNMVSPYSTSASPDDQGWWAERIVKRFFNAPDPEGAGYGDAVVFAAACTVASIVGYLVQQFIIGTGIAKVAGKIGDRAAIPHRAPRDSRALLSPYTRGCHHGTNPLSRLTAAIGTVTEPAPSAIVHRFAPVRNRIE